MTASLAMTPNRPTLEVCVDTPTGLAAAVAGGADRIELCGALSLHGLTPAPGLMAQAARMACPVYAMIRSRQGDFVYGPTDLDAMRRDIDAARAYGLAGVVVGANRSSGELDADALSALRTHAAGLGVTLHRAFDLVPDFSAALEAAIELGFERILTSGGQRSAPAGAERLATLVGQAAGRISIMAGAGLNADNVADLIARTGVREVHGSCSGPAREGLGAGHADRGSALGFTPPGLRDTSAVAVGRMVEVLRGL
jgi:copper homeostasis protein